MWRNIFGVVILIFMVFFYNLDGVLEFLGFEDSMDIEDIDTYEQTFISYETKSIGSETEYLFIREGDTARFRLITSEVFDENALVNDFQSNMDFTVHIYEIGGFYDDETNDGYLIGELAGIETDDKVYMSTQDFLDYNNAGKVSFETVKLVSFIVYMVGMGTFLTLNIIHNKKKKKSLQDTEKPSI